MQVLASISDDCQVKLWNIKSIQKDHESSNGFIEQFMTLRGHSGPIMSITGSQQDTDKLLFTAGQEGIIRVWNAPENAGDEKFPTTNGRNHCVAVLDDSVSEPVWQVQYHPFTNMLLSLKSEKLIQVWDCKDIVEKAKSYSHGDVEKCKADFLKLTSPMKEFSFDEAAKDAVPTSCSWLPTDSNLFVVGFSSGQVAFFDYKTGKVQHSADLESEVVSITSHELQSVIVTGHLDGNIKVYDFSTK